MDHWVVSPDHKTFSSLISACGWAQQWEQAIDHFDRMKREKLPTDSITYTALISTCVKAGRWDKSLFLLKDMQRRILGPTIRTYNPLIQACELEIRDALLAG